MAMDFRSQGCLTDSDTELVDVSTQNSSSQEMPLARNEPQIAIRRTCHPPWLQCCVHVVSVAYTIAILALNWTNVYFKDLASSNINSILNAFQLVARLHDSIVGASLAAIVLDHLRYELCAAGGLPLGYLMTPFQLSMPQTIFTQEFWSATMASGTSKRKYWFGAVVILATLVTAIIGPFSAILLLPELGWWHVKHVSSGKNGFTYLNATYEDLWPSHIGRIALPSSCNDSGRGPEEVCPFAGYSDISRWSADHLSQLSPANITVYATGGTLRYLYSDYQSQQELGYAVASTSMSFLTRNLGTMWLYAQSYNLTFAKHGQPMITLVSLEGQKPIMRPLVQTQCATPLDITDMTGPVDVEFPTSHLVWDTDQEPLESITLEGVDLTPFQPDLEPGSPIKPQDLAFYDLGSQATKPLIGALFGMTFWNADQALGSSHPDNVGQGLMACSIISHWAPASMSLQPYTSNAVIVSDSTPSRLIHSKSVMSQAISIDVDLEYISQLNTPYQPTSNWSSIEYILGWLRFNPPYYDGGWNHSWPWLVATSISMQLADGLARFGDGTPMYVYCEDCYNFYTKNVTSFATNLADLNNFLSIAYTQPDKIAEEPDLYTVVQWNIQRFGYAWSFNRATKIIAASVVVLHMLYVLVHFVIVFKRKWHSRSWTSALELVILALQSPQSKLLEGATAGVSDKSTYSDTVSIRENEYVTGGAMLKIGREHDAMSGKSPGYHAISSGQQGFRRLTAGTKY